LTFGGASLNTEAKPRLFIGSSKEALDWAWAVQANLEHDCEPTVWDQGIFEPSSYTIESLVRTVGQTDFAAFLFTRDDIVRIRGKQTEAVRDNVVFELGLFVGGLGRNRCFILLARSEEDLRLPTDLLGLTPVTFDPSRQDENRKAALGPACNEIRKIIRELGPRSDTQTKDLADLDQQVASLSAEKDLLQDILTKAAADGLRDSAQATPATSPPTWASEAGTLSGEAKEVLLAATEKDADGMILVVATMGGTTVQGGSKVLNVQGDPRSEALYKKAVKDLVAVDLAEPKGHKGEVFEVTHSGWQVADGFRQSS